MKKKRMQEIKVTTLASGHEEGWQWQIGCDVYNTGGIKVSGHIRTHCDKGRYAKHPETYKPKNHRWYRNNPEYFIKNKERYAEQRKRWKIESKDKWKVAYDKQNAKRRQLGFHPISFGLGVPFEWHHVNCNDVVACPSYIHQHVAHVCGDDKLEGVLG